MTVGAIQAFKPNGTTALSVTSGAATNASLTGLGGSVLITNGCADFVFVRIAGGTATATDTPVPAGGRLLLDCPSLASAGSTAAANLLKISVYPNSVGGTVFATIGDGTTY